MGNNIINMRERRRTVSRDRDLVELNDKAHLAYRVWQLKSETQTAIQDIRTLRWRIERLILQVYGFIAVCLGLVCWSIFGG